MSYQDKQLKKEFITVDNRTIPFGYPQFWGGDDWEVSGRDNPLPVANYTRNEQGLWVPVSNENPVPTQLTGSRVEDVIERKIYNDSMYLYETIDVPKWANSLMIDSRIYGITGSNVEVVLRSSMDGVISNELTKIETTETTPIRVAHLYGMGDLGDSLPFSSVRKIKTTNIRPINRISVFVNITGSFNEGEGVDLGVAFSWR